MMNAAHLRAQAKLCFAIADLMSAPADGQVARSAAERYIRLAEKAEKDLSLPGH